MILEGLHEKGIFAQNSLLRIAMNTEVNYEYPLHWHSAVELVYAAENGCTVNANSREFVLSEKDILLIAAGDLHNFFTRSQKGKVVFIQFDFTRLDSSGSLAPVRPYLSQTRLVPCREEKQLHAELEKHIIAIIEEYGINHFASDLFLHARVLDILVLLSRSLYGRSDVKMDRKKAGRLEKLERAFQFLEENYQNPISLKDTAKATGFSEYHFSRIFKEVTERNFHHYLNELRVKKAEKLLTGTDASIASAAHASGFNSIATFNRTFKQLKGCSPSSYLKLRV